jgi:hypothetical protein
MRTIEVIPRIGCIFFTKCMPSGGLILAWKAIVAMTTNINMSHVSLIPSFLVLIYMEFHTRRTNMPMSSSLNRTEYMYIVMHIVHLMFYKALCLNVLRNLCFPKVWKYSYLYIAELGCHSFSTFYLGVSVCLYFSKVWKAYIRV